MSSSEAAGNTSVAMPQPTTRDAVEKPIRILYVEQNLDGTIGGSYRSLLYLLGGLAGHPFAPIAAFYREHELLDEYRRVGCRTLLLYHPKPLDLSSALRRMGVFTRWLTPLVGLVQKLVNLTWVSGFLFFRG